MKTKKELLAMARETIKDHKHTLQALRKTGRRKTSGKIVPAYPLLTHVLETNKKGIVSATAKGVQFVLLEDGKPVGIVDFTRGKKAFRFSHFSFNKNHSKVLLAHIKHLRKKFNLPESQVFEIVKSGPFGNSFLRMKVDGHLQFLVVDPEKKFRFIGNKTLLNEYESHVEELKKNEAEFKLQKEESAENKMARLRQLNYL